MFKEDYKVETLTEIGTMFLNNEEFIAKIRSLDKTDPEKFGIAAEQIFYDSFANMPLSDFPGDVLQLDYRINEPNYTPELNLKDGDFRFYTSNPMLAFYVDTKFSTWDEYFPCITKASMKAFGGMYILFNGDLSSVLFVDSEFFRYLYSEEWLDLTMTDTIYGKNYNSYIEHGINERYIIRVDK